MALSKELNIDPNVQMGLTGVSSHRANDFQGFVAFPWFCSHLWELRAAIARLIMNNMLQLSF